MLYGILVIMTIVLILILGTLHVAIAVKNKDIRNSTLGSTTTITIPLPFNSHIEDLAKDETASSINSLPFP